MSEAIASVLSQIRTLQSQINQPAAPLQEAQAGSKVPGFAETLQKAAASVNDTQLESARLKTAFEFGDPKVDLVRVMIASQEAQIGFRATVEVRNRLVQAYQDVMNMPI
jgi:flagellar hook-basal body complex protein FliE